MLKESLAKRLEWKKSAYVELIEKLKNEIRKRRFAFSRDDVVQRLLLAADEYRRAEDSSIDGQAVSPGAVA